MSPVDNHRLSAVRRSRLAALSSVKSSVVLSKVFFSPHPTPEYNTLWLTVLKEPTNYQSTTDVRRLSQRHMCQLLLRIGARPAMGYTMADVFTIYTYMHVFTMHPSDYATNHRTLLTMISIDSVVHRDTEPTWKKMPECIML